MQRKVAARRITAVVFGLFLVPVILVVIECSLVLISAGKGPPGYDPLLGFSSSVPLFELASRQDGTSIYRVSPARLSHTRIIPETSPAGYEAEREFLAEKPANSFRVFVVGGSSAARHPYGPVYAFSAWLARRLESGLPSMNVEVVNTALSGYGTRRILVIVREIVTYDLCMAKC